MSANSITSEEAIALISSEVVRINEDAPLPSARFVHPHRQARVKVQESGWGTGDGNPLTAFIGWNTSYAPYAGFSPAQSGQLPSGSGAYGGIYGGYGDSNGLLGDRTVFNSNLPPGIFTEIQWRLILSANRFLLQDNPIAESLCNRVAAYIGPCQVQFVPEEVALSGVMSDDASEDPDAKATHLLWNRFRQKNAWGPALGTEDREKEFRIRLSRDGEAIIRVGAGDEEADHIPWCRFVNPEQLRYPADEAELSFYGPDYDWREGICRHKDDPETPLAYWICYPDSGGGKGEEVPAKNIIRVKLGVDACIVRGNSDFFNVSKHLREAITILTNMEGSTRKQTQVDWIQKYSNAVENQVRQALLKQGFNKVDNQGMPIGSGQGGFGGQGGWGFPMYSIDGSYILHVKDNVEFEAGPTSTGTSGYLQVYDTIIKTVRDKFGLPDDDDSSFAAALVDGSRFVIIIIERQDQIRGAVYKLAKRVSELGEESGKLAAGVAKRIEPLVTAKPPVNADEEKKSRMGLSEIDKGVKSPQEFIRERNRNPKHVIAENKAWKEQAGPPPGENPLGGDNPPGGGGSPVPNPGPNPTPPGSAGGDGSSPNFEESKEVREEWIEEQAGPHKFSSTQINLVGEAAYAILNLGKQIKSEDLCVEEGGCEEEPHVTVRYGLHEDATQEQVADIVHAHGPIKFWLGKISTFTRRDPGKEYDVVKVDVAGEDLVKLNKALAVLPHTDTFKTYKPHATIAHVTAGKGDSYAKKFGSLDMEVIANRVVFSPAAHSGQAVLMLNESNAITEHAPSPPFPGGVFNETSHHWEKPAEIAKAAKPSAPSFDGKMQQLLSHAKGLPKALAAKASSWIQGKYTKLAERYGSTGAKAILASAILLTPVPLPGTTLIPIALAEGVRRLYDALKSKRVTEEAPLTQEQIEEEARNLIEEFNAAFEVVQEESPVDVNIADLLEINSQLSEQVRVQEEHLANPPFPGGVFNENTHRWEKPNAQPTSKKASQSAKIETEKKPGFVHQTKGEIPKEAGQQSTPEEYTHAVKMAIEKFKVVPKPTRDELKQAKAGLAKHGANKYRRNLVGNTGDRRKRRESLLKEFGNGKTCPCIYCGVKIGEGSLEQDKIITTAQGGRYRTPNLVPSCSGCNKQRGDKPFAEIVKRLIPHVETT